MGSLTDEQVLNLAIMFSVLFGAIIGSFLNVVIYRLPKKQSIAKERSHCPNCKKQIENLDNIPVLSYIALRGKCRNCKTRISFRYPLVEILTAAIWGVTVWRVGIHLYTIGYLIFFSGLIALSFIDFEHMLLPKKIIYATGGALIAFLVFSSVINEELNRVRDAAIVGVAYFAFFLLMWLATQQKAMGFGDVRLSFFLGLSMGYFGFVVSYAGLLLSFLLGSVIGIVFVAVTGKGRKAKIPFGPFLALGTIIVIWCAPAISDLVQLNHV